MWYYSTFSLELERLTPEQNKEDIIKDLRESNEEAEYALDEEWDTESNTKWYDFSPELTEFSKKYPNVLFIIDRIGEEYGDITKTYFLNWKSVETIWKVVFDPFIEMLLK